MSRARDLADGTFDTLKVFDSALTDSLTLSVDTASDYVVTGTVDDVGLSFDNNTSIRGYRFSTNGSEKVRIDSDGLKFNGDTAAANALDDYEEGDFTPTASVGTLTFTHARYTKIGNLVTVCMTNINFSNITSTTQIQINGLPFASASNSTSIGSLMAQYRDNQTAITPYNSSNASWIRIYENSRTGSFTALPYNIYNNASANSTYLTLTYRTA